MNIPPAIKISSRKLQRWAASPTAKGVAAMVVGGVLVCGLYYYRAEVAALMASWKPAPPPAPAAPVVPIEEGRVTPATTGVSIAPGAKAKASYAATAAAQATLPASQRGTVTAPTTAKVTAPRPSGLRLQGFGAPLEHTFTGDGEW